MATGAPDRVVGETGSFAALAPLLSPRASILAMVPVAFMQIADPRLAAVMSTAKGPAVDAASHTRRSFQMLRQLVAAPTPGAAAAIGARYRSAHEHLTSEGFGETVLTDPNVNRWAYLCLYDGLIATWAAMRGGTRTACDADVVFAGVRAVAQVMVGRDVMPETRSDGDAAIEAALREHAVSVGTDQVHLVDALSGLGSRYRIVGIGSRPFLVSCGMRLIQPGIATLYRDAGVRVPAMPMPLLSAGLRAAYRLGGHA